MARVKFGKVTRARRNVELNVLKVIMEQNILHIRKHNEQVVRSMAYAFIGRKQKKRDFRKIMNRDPQAIKRVSETVVKEEVKVEPIKEVKTVKEVKPVEVEEKFEEVSLEETHDFLAQMEAKYAEHLEEPTKVEKVEPVKAVEETKVAEKTEKHQNFQLKERAKLDGSDVIQEQRSELQKYANKLRTVARENKFKMAEVNLRDMTKKELIKYMQTIRTKEVRSYFDGDYDKNNFDDNSKQIIMDVQATLASVNSDSLKKATDLILKANRINVCAIGGNLTVKQEIEHKLAKIGKHEEYMNEVFKMEYVYLDIDLKSQKETFSFIAKKAKELKLVTNEQALIQGFQNREKRGFYLDLKMVLQFLMQESRS
ncbi:hypothetical protein FQA39_LY12810 [Lamprigera yunnana]|nr:hypothetical protein FQA39_LY12810 [Lamprigera yunnana]